MLFKGCPIVGDRLYAKGRNLPKDVPRKINNLIYQFNRQALHAKKIVFNHPIKNIPLKLKAEKPLDFLKLEKVLFEN